MFRVVRICISMHDSCIQLHQGKEKDSVLNSVLQVIKTYQEVRKVQARHFSFKLLQAGLCQSRTHSLSGAANALPDHPVHFCLNGITMLGWAPSSVFAAS